MRYSIKKGTEKFNKIHDMATSKRAIKYFRACLYSELLSAEMNGCSYDELHDSKKMAAHRLKGIAKHLKELLENQKGLITFHCVNKEIPTHYEINRLKKENEELNQRINIMEQKIYAF